MQVLMKLHNFCIDHNVPVPPVRFREDCRHGDEWAAYPNHHVNDAQLRARATGDRRKNITEELEARGIIRPPHAAINSRAN